MGHQCSGVDPAGSGAYSRSQCDSSRLKTCQCFREERWHFENWQLCSLPPHRQRLCRWHLAIHSAWDSQTRKNIPKDRHLGYRLHNSWNLRTLKDMGWVKPRNRLKYSPLGTEKTPSRVQLIFITRCDTYACQKTRRSSDRYCFTQYGSHKRFPAILAEKYDIVLTRRRENSWRKWKHSEIPNKRYKLQ